MVTFLSRLSLTRLPLFCFPFLLGLRLTPRVALCLGSLVRVCHKVHSCQAPGAGLLVFLLSLLGLPSPFWHTTRVHANHALVETALVETSLFC